MENVYPNLGNFEKRKTKQRTQITNEKCPNCYSSFNFARPNEPLECITYKPRQCYLCETICNRNIEPNSLDELHSHYGKSSFRWCVVTIVRHACILVLYVRPLNQERKIQQKV